jgi:MFS superfamily sulfate permease-like transporter
MWVVMLSILLSYVLQWTGNTSLIPTEMTIVIPEDLFGQYQAPDFSLIGTPNFWIAVITLTLIASIETLLSVKGIERLDIYKRKANTNKDLRAHGLATTISGLLGGLNVVTVLARSSVNVNNGAQTRNSNLFHAVLLGLIIFFLEDLVSRIPLPALAAILVYTGYKLASPENFKRIAKLGWEAVLVYTITFFVTISQGIITGILTGIFVAFALQLITTNRPGLILRNLFKPNALLYTEEDGTYILSVKKFANFMNFMRIRKKMDSIPTGANIIVDFTLCDFIDNSVMEHLGGYDQIHARRGGHVEIVGLDDLQASSEHPFATWIPIVGNKADKQKVLSNRQKSLKIYAQELSMNFYSPANSAVSSLGVFNYFQTKSLDVLRNEIAGEVGRARVKLFDLDYHLGEFIALEKVHISLVTIDFEFLTPDFILHEENFLERVAAASGFTDINFVKHPDFSKRFFLKGPHPQKVKRFFNKELIQFFEANNSYNIESKSGRLLIFEKERLSGISEIKLMVSFAIRLAELVQTLHKK